MPRWLTRLLILGIIGAAALFVISRLMNQEEDFDDFDDIDAGFEFEETPVEIDVPVEESVIVAEEMPETRATSATAPATGPLDAGSENGAASNTAATSASSSGQDTVILSLHPEGSRLIDINGIGRTYEARLQSIGINSLQELANANPDAVAEQLDVIGGRATVEDWIAQARDMLSNESQAEQ